MKVLVTDLLSEEGLGILRQSGIQVDARIGIKPEEIVSIIGDYDALLVRSQTKVTADIIQAGKNLQVIGRAGVGIDNIDVEAATRCGVIVVNAPTANTVSAAEHTIALMLSLARQVPQANASLKSGQWKRNDFVGVELRDQTLGIIGLGNVGSEVARRMRPFGMKLLGYDPFVSSDHASKLQIQIVPLEQIYRESDFITLHIPLNAQTKGLIGAKEIGMMKPTVRLINVARGGLMDDNALVAALKEKRVGGVAIDVFEKEPTTQSPLFEFSNVIVTPHLGASTTEAQVTAAKDVAEQVVEVFRGEPARYAVNAPFIPATTLAMLVPYCRVANLLGKLVHQLAEGQVNSIHIKYDGEISNHDTNVLKAAVIGGLLEGLSEERINIVNANLVAARRGLSVTEHKDAACQNYSSLITVEVTASGGPVTVGGTVLNGECHIVRVNNYWLDIVPTGAYFLFSDHRDRPGLIGAVGKITGDADINISSMHLGRLKSRGEALLVLALDEPLHEKQRQQILAIPDVYTVKVVKL